MAIQLVKRKPEGKTLIQVFCGMTLQDRADAYAKEFPKFPAPSVVVAADGTERLEALWIMGQNYTTQTNFYGAYPHGYLRRVGSMFKDKTRVLHVCSGSLPKSDAYTRFDIVQDAEVNGDAQELSKYFKPDSFDIVYVDVPYSNEDAVHYGTVMLSRKKVLAECAKVLVSGGWVVCLDQVLWMWNKEVWHLGMVVGVIKSSNHRVRAVFGFEKK